MAKENKTSRQLKRAQLTLSEALGRMVEWGIYLWLFLLPWQIRYFIKIATLNDNYWEAGTFTVYLSEVLLLILLLLKVLQWLLAEEKSKKNALSSNFFTSLPYALAGFSLFAAFSLLWSVNPSLTLYYAVKIIAAYLAFCLLINSRISLSRAFSVLIAAGVIQGYLAVQQFTNQLVVGSKWLGMATQDARNLGVSVVDTGIRRWLRAYGSFPHPNILGGFLVITLVLAIRQYLQTQVARQKQDSKQLKWYGLAVLVAVIFLAAGIALSFSRAAWLVALLVWISFLVWVLRQKKIWLMSNWLKLFTIFAVTVGIWAATYPEPFFTRITGKSKLEARSIEERARSLSEASEIVADNWWTGTGLGSYTLVLSQRFPNLPAWSYQPAHNTYLLILAELGVFGLLFLLWVIAALLSGRLSITIFTLSISVLFLLLFDHWWWTISFGWYLFFVLLAFVWLDKNKGLLKKS